MSLSRTGTRENFLRSLSVLALLVGAAIRIAEYASNRSLSIDESFLALNLIEKSPRELLHELDFAQAAPLGFLEFEKFAIALFGRSEYALRVLPLLVSLASLFFFYRAARRLLPLAAVPFSCAAFALLDPLIYYGATAKQYSFDVAATVILYAVAAPAGAGRATRTDLIKLGALGATAVWFSHAAAFVVAAIGITLAVYAVVHRGWERLLGVALAGAVASISLGVELHLSSANVTRIQQSFRAGSGLLASPGSAGGNWFDNATSRVRYLVGLEDTATGYPILGSLPAGVNQGLTVLLCAAVTLGLLSLLRRRLWSALVLGIPPLLVLAASALHKYPLVGRTLLFLLPAVALCIGEALRVLLFGVRSRLAALGAGAAVASVLAIALLPAIHLFEQRASEGIRPALGALGRNYRPGDALYVGHYAQYGFVYYHLCECASIDPAAIWPFGLRGDPSGAAPALTPHTPALILGRITSTGRLDRRDEGLLLGKGRVWLLISEEQPSDLDPFLASLGRAGRRLRQFGPFGVRGTAASLYLYDLGATSRG